MENIQSSPLANQEPLSKYSIGKSLFLFLEVLLFGGLFAAYLFFFKLNSSAFGLASTELSSTYGWWNTIVLLLTSFLLFKSYQGLKANLKTQAMGALLVALILGFIFIINKLFVWKGKVDVGLYPGSSELWQYGAGDSLFYFFYYMLDGIHALHILAGIFFMVYAILKVDKNEFNDQNTVAYSLIIQFWYILTIIWLLIWGGFYLLP